MRFTVLYNHTPSVREQVMALLSSALNKGHNPEQTTLNHPLFSTRQSWPDLKTLLHLPLTTQCEELEWSENALHSIRVQIVDVEVVVIKEELPLDKPTNPQ